MNKKNSNPEPVYSEGSDPDIQVELEKRTLNKKSNPKSVYSEGSDPHVLDVWNKNIEEEKLESGSGFSLIIQTQDPSTNQTFLSIDQI